MIEPYSLIRPVIEENEVQTQLSEADIDLRAHFLINTVWLVLS